MTTLGNRPVRALAATALLAGLLAGCSDSDTGDAGDGGPQDAASYDTGTLLPAVREAVEGAGSVHLGIGDSTPPSDVEVDITWEDADEFRALVGDTPANILEILEVGGRAYVGGEAAGDEWRYLELDDPRLTGEQQDFDAGVVPTLLALDVPGDFEAIEGAVTEVSHQGAEKVNGVAAERYAVTVDAQDWQAALPDASMHRAMTVPDSVEMQLWLDEESLPVRWAYAGAEAADTARVDYSGWGTPFAVAEPKDAQPAG